MVKYNLVVRLLAIAALFQVSAANADNHLIKLENNPFSVPDVVTRKPPPIKTVNVQAQSEPEKVELDLIATMVSETAPMVIVNGELIGLGEKIDGLKLIEVREGEAVFRKKGKKYTFVIGGSDQD